MTFPHRHHFVPNAPVTISSVSKPTPKIISNPDQSLLYLAGIVDSSNIEEAHNVVSEAYQLKSIWGPTAQSFFHKTKSTGAFEYSAIELVPVDVTKGIKFKLIGIKIKGSYQKPTTDFEARNYLAKYASDYLKSQEK